MSGFIKAGIGIAVGLVGGLWIISQLANVAIHTKPEYDKVGVSFRRQT